MKNIYYKAIPFLFIFLIMGTIFNYDLCLAGDKRIIKDMAGREVSVPADVRKIVALGPGVLRLVVYLQAFDMVVGIEQIEKEERVSSSRPYSLAIKDKTKRLPVVSTGGPGKLPDIEAIMMVKPDVVFVLGIETSQVDSLQAKSGIPFVVVTYGDFGVFKEHAIKSLLLMGKILKKEKRAGAVRDFFETNRAELINRTKNINVKANVYVGGLSYKGLHGISSTDTLFPPFAMVNANNVAGEVETKGHIFIDKENLIKWNPDFLFLDINSLGIIEEDFQKIPIFYQSINAVKGNRVFSILPYNAYNTNVELLLANAFFVGKTIYPYLFKDIDCIDKTNEITAFFLGLPLYEQIQAVKGGFGNIVFEDEKVHIR